MNINTSSTLVLNGDRIELNTGLASMKTFILGSYGTAGQVLKSDGTYTTWGYSNQISDGISYVQCNTNGSIIIQASDTAITAGLISLGPSGDITLIAENNPINIVCGLNGLNYNAELILDHGGNVKIRANNTYGTAGQVLTSDGTYTSWQSPSGSFVDAYQIYVSPNGNDTTGTGSQQKPYLTIGKAITQRATLSTSTEVSIILSSGTYTENLTLVRNTYLVGVPTGEARQPCNIIGNITLNDTTGTMGLSGLEITGNISTLGGGATYILFGCNISNTTTAINATAGTVFITECRISTSSGVVIISLSTLTLRDCNISTSGTSSCISASSITTVRQCNVVSSSSSTSVQPLLQLTSNSATLIIEFCRFEYTSSATDVAGNKCCIKFTNASGTLSASISNSLLLCEGAITGSPNIQCIQDTGAGAVNLSYGGLIAGATAHNISPNTTKTQYTTVP